MVDNQTAVTLREKSLEILLNEIDKKLPQNILEIGTGEGNSGVQMLKHTLHSATLVTIESNPQNIQTSAQNFETNGLINNVMILEGDCTKILNELQKPTKAMFKDIIDKKLISTKFDFVFLDGPKGQYVKMLPTIIELMDKGAVLVADNVLFRGYVKDIKSCPRRFKTIAKRLGQFIDECNTNDKLKNTKLHEIEDGILVTTKR